MSLTKDDLQKISNLLNSSEVRIKSELKEYIDEKVSFLPTRDEFNDGVDKIYGLQKKNDEQILLLSGRVYRLEEELAKIKDKIGIE